MSAHIQSINSLDKDESYLMPACAQMYNLTTIQKTDGSLPVESRLIRYPTQNDAAKPKTPTILRESKATRN